MSGLSAIFVLSTVVLVTFVLLLALLIAGVEIATRSLKKNRQKTEEGPGPDAMIAGDPVCQESLRLIWSSVLERSVASTNETFFAAGGDSLSALRMLSEVRAQFGVEISISEFFESPTISKLAALLEQCKRPTLRASQSVEESVLVGETEEKGPFHPLSFSQEALWKYQQYLPHAWTFNMPLTLRLQGDLNEDKLQFAFRAVVQRHEALRTLFKEVNGVPQQQIIEAPPLEIQLEQAHSDIQEIIDAEERDPFDLANGPLFRVRLIRLGPKEHLLLLTIHHIVFDGWSYALLFRDLSGFYNGHSEGVKVVDDSNALRYVSFSRWVRRYADSRAVERQLEYWKEKLKNLALAEIPPDVSAETREPRNGRYHSLQFAEQTVTRLKRLCSDEGVSLFALLTSLLALIISLKTGREKVSLGTIVANRKCLEFRNTVGFFVNAVVLVSDIQDNIPFTEFLYKNQRNVAEALDNQEVPFGRLIEAFAVLNQSMSNPFYQSTFILQHDLLKGLSFEGLSVERYKAGYNIARGDFVVEVEDVGRTLLGGIYYDAGRFSSTTIEELAYYFEALQHLVIQNPRILIADMLNPVRQAAAKKPTQAIAEGA